MKILVDTRYLLWCGHVVTTLKKCGPTSWLCYNHNIEDLEVCTQDSFGREWRW